ncbi:MAG TPA: hypothetical protein PK971_11545 [Saprospiraceae bacterium]|nr:hypothetical protein [Saprospiraceae bacterium]HNG90419.1 hypothetical protein [Saprospiraceae bacterium]
MSNLSPLLQAFRRHPAVQHILQHLDGSSPAPPLRLKGLMGAQESFVLASVAQLRPAVPLHLFVATHKDEAAYRRDDLEGLLGHEAAYFFPDSFKRPAYFEDLHPTQMLQRSEVVSKITGHGETLAAAAVVTYPEALFEKVVRPDILNKSRIEVQKGQRLDVDFIIEVLLEYGFERTDFVYEPGQFSIRGGIVDLFSYGNDLPYRIELFDDEVEAIRLFDPLTQLSERNIAHVSIVPNLNTRFRQDQKTSLLHMLPPGTVVWVKDWQLLLDRLQVCFERAEVFASKLTALDSAELRDIFRDRAFLYPGEVQEALQERSVIHLGG